MWKFWRYRPNPWKPKPSKVDALGRIKASDEFDKPEPMHVLSFKVMQAVIDALHDDNRPVVAGPFTQMEFGDLNSDGTGEFTMTVTGRYRDETP